MNGYIIKYGDNNYYNSGVRAVHVYKDIHKALFFKTRLEAKIVKERIGSDSFRVMKVTNGKEGSATGNYIMW